MKKSIQTLVFALLLGVCFASCKKKEEVVPCFETAFVGVTYANTAGETYKVKTADCKVIELENSKNGSTFSIKYTITAGSAGAYTLTNPLFDVSMTISATTLTLSGDSVFTGTKR